MNTIIGISGVAGSGKDTFFNLLSARAPCKRYSLADELKREVNQWCRMHYGIDSQACTREEKEIIRPLLVFHGGLKRQASEGRYWIERLKDRLVKDKFNGFKIVTDIRYDEYENDEVSWLKNELNGILVHVSQYEMKSGRQYFRAAANPEEERNDPIIREKSDFQIEWEFIKNGQISELNSYIDNFIEWLNHETASRQHPDKKN
jgi:hypothetical protein